MVEQGRLIEIIGSTGSGKTTFAEELGHALGATVLLETSKGNPYMADAHRADKHSWDNQFWFLQKYVERLNEATKLVEGGKIVIIDTGLPTYILHSKLILTPEQNIQYSDLAARLTQHLSLPDLTLHLKDTTDFLMDRLKKRHKDYDDATPDFIDQLTELHNAWTTQTNLPVMTIRSRDLENEKIKTDIITTIVLTIKL